MEILNSSSRAMTISTASRESAPRSLTNSISGLMAEAGLPVISETHFTTLERTVESARAGLTGECGMVEADSEGLLSQAWEHRDNAIARAPRAILREVDFMPGRVVEGEGKWKRGSAS